MKPRSFIPRSAIKKRPRKPSETLRIYGGKKRLLWVKTLPCAACGFVGASVNAHIENGGTGRKADYTKIIPLCGMRTYSNPATTTWYIGCHFLFDEQRYNFDISYPDFNPERVAAETQARWLAYQEGA